MSLTDERLAALLAAKSKALQANTIHITHQQLADELASSREVISRLLKFVAPAEIKDNSPTKKVLPTLLPRK